jgi:hypothetical protein
VIAFDAGPKLSLGEILVTPGAAAKLPHEDVARALSRHARGDWGELDDPDRRLNDQRLTNGGPIASIYTASNGLKFYVLTEADRTTTTVLLPEEY